MALPWQDPPFKSNELKIERNVVATMRDGTELAADIYRPTDGGPWPVLLMRLPYDKTQAETSGFAPPHWYARHGYMVVVQDCRGRWRSRGKFRPFVDEATDGADTIAWARELPGSNGKIGTFGYSYAGAGQLLAAPLAEHLDVMATAFTANDFYENWTYRGGVLNHAFSQSWANFLSIDTARRLGNEEAELELLSAEIECTANFFKRPLTYYEDYLEGLAPYYREWLEHDSYDKYWQERSARPNLDKISAPVLHVGGWYDIFLEGTLDSFRRLTSPLSDQAQRGEQKLVIGPWYHSPWHQNLLDLDFGEDARSCVDALQIHWFDRHLKGKKNQLNKEKPVALFVMGRNKWRFTDSWPPQESRIKTFYLHSAGRANSLSGNGTIDRKKPQAEPFDTYVYDPANPVFSLGGHSCCNPAVLVMGPTDQRPQECRNDILVFTGKPLEEDLEVIGTVEMFVYAASTATDTDFTAKLVDVYPDGRAINILEGIINTSKRESLSEPSPIEADKIYEYNIKLGSTAMLFKAGHRLRVEISSSNFPVFLANDNSGKKVTERGVKDRFVATQTVFHDAEHSTRLLLPVFK